MIIFFDIILVFFLFLITIKNKQFDILNPSLIYLFIHVLFVTFKGIQTLVFGSEIISNRFYSTYITIDDIAKAIMIADLGLLAFFIGFYMFKNKFSNKGKRLLLKYAVIVEERPKLIKIYMILVIILGIIGLLSYTFIPGIGKENFATGTFTSILASLGMISSIILIYEYGFKFKFVLFFVGMCLIYSIQGVNRYRVILPLLFLLLYYLKIKKLKFPPLKFMIIGFVVILLSFPLKEIGYSIRDGQKIELTEIIAKSFKDLVSGESGDLAFIEQSAAMINSTDDKNIIFYGRTYMPILIFWIPRDYWKEKPKLNEWQFEISSAGRDYGEMGQISLLTGEAYANFRLFGVFFIPLLVGIFYSKIYFSFSKLHEKHKGFLLLLIYNMILFQTWRDGLISLILFPLLNYLPLIVLFFIKKPKINKIAYTN